MDRPAAAPEVAIAPAVPAAGLLICDHCQGPIGPGELVRDETLPPDPAAGGRSRQFCCAGCLGAYRIITGAGLDDFYRKREWQEKGPLAGAFRTEFDPELLARQVRHRPDGAELRFQVEGIRCAACIWLIEKIMARQAGVLQARGNYATYQLQVVFDPARIDPAALFAVVARLGYRPALPSRGGQGERLGREQRALLFRFGTAVFLTLQLKSYSLALYAGYFQGMEESYRQLLQVLAAVVTTPVVFYSGWPFIRGGWRSLRNLAPDMDLLVALGVLAAYGYSVYGMLVAGEVYFDTAAMIVTLILLGRLLENGARRRASAGVERLLALAPETAQRIVSDHGAPHLATSGPAHKGTDLKSVPDHASPSGLPLSIVGARRRQPEAPRGRLPGGSFDRLQRIEPAGADDPGASAGEQLQTVAADELRPGDLVLVRPGERFPVDCRLAAGITEVDEAIISGEAMPVTRRAGDEIPAGVINVGAAVRAVVLRPAATSFVARMAELVAESQARKAPVQRLADQVAAVFVPLVMVFALLTGLFWLGQGSGAGAALLPMVAVLVVACPCALGLATPTAIMVASGTAAGRGFLFRGGDVLEKTARLTLAAFDKTGTLTEGRPTVTAISDPAMLPLASRLAAASAHPLARAIVVEAGRQGIMAQAGNAEAVAGQGIREMTAAGEARLGSRQFLAAAGVEIPAVALSDRTEAHLALAGRYLGSFVFSDPLRPEAAPTLAELCALGIKTAILSGDHPASVARLARQLEQQWEQPEGRTAVSPVPLFAQGGMAPAAKKEWIEASQAKGERVLMAGDGINDAPALAAAAVGCSLSGGTDIALESADLVLIRPNLALLPRAVRLARRTLRIIRQNLFWAFIYNIMALPLAASGRLAPIYAAAAMAASSVCVIANSLRLTSGRRAETEVHDAGGGLPREQLQSARK